VNVEQFARAKFVHDLRVTVSPDWMQGQYHDLPTLPSPDHFWLHSTDLPLEDTGFWKRLLSEQLIEFVPEIQYQKRGDWMDSFPPSVYRLTAKGRCVLDNPSEYVYAVGETS